MKNGFAIALGIGALLLLGSNNKTSTSTCPGRWVKLPSGDIVCETVLPSMGYILYSDGKWYHRTQFQPPAGTQYSGTNTNTAQWQGILTNLISQGVNLFQRFHYEGAGAEPEIWAGDAGDAGAGGDPYAGVGFITVTPNGMTRWICRDGRYSTAHGQGACTNHRGILYKHKK